MLSHTPECLQQGRGLRTREKTVLTVYQAPLPAEHRSKSFIPVILFSPRDVQEKTAVMAPFTRGEGRGARVTVS